MKRLLNASFIYMLAGVASGLFYREFTKLNDFPEGQFTQLGLAHTHLLTLGFIVLLIVLALEKVFTTSRSPCCSPPCFSPLETSRTGGGASGSSSQASSCSSPAVCSPPPRPPRGC